MHARARSLCPPTIESIEYRSESSSPLPGYASSDRILGGPAPASTLRGRSQGPVERGLCARFAEPTRQSVGSVLQASEAPTRGTCFKGILAERFHHPLWSTDSSGSAALSADSGATRFESTSTGTPAISANWLGGLSCDPTQVRDPRQPPLQANSTLLSSLPSARILASGPIIPCIHGSHPCIPRRMLIFSLEGL